MESIKFRAGLVAASGLLLVGVVSGCSAIGWYNDSVKMESSVKAQYNNNRNEYDAFWKKVKETAQVPDKYKDDFKEVLIADTTAKYGKDGSQAMFQWFNDRDVKLDPKLYTRVQDVIEVGRNDFKRGQTELLDKQRVYQVHVNSFWGRMAGGLMGFPSEVKGDLAPTKDLDGDGVLTVLDYPIVTSKKTDTAFKNAEDDELKVFNEGK